MRTLEAAFDPRRNSLNALRLAFATAVIVAHSWALTGREGGVVGVGPYNELGAWAVSGFFVISGYLITNSRDHTTLPVFLWRRFLRIYPAFIVVLLVTAFVFAPLSTLVMGDYSIAGAVGYVLKNAGLYVVTYGVPDTLAHAPLPVAWNGSLWTLFYEALCYVGIGILMTIVPRRWLGPALWCVLIGGTAATAVHDFTGEITTTLYLHTFRLGTYFAAGALLYVYRSKVAYRWEFAAVAAVWLAATALTGTFDFLGPLPLAYLCMWLGVALPLHQVGEKNDISYGMYVYAFPVQQLLAITVGRVLPLWAFMLAAIACTIPFAWASRIVVERPAMRLKNLVKKPVRAAPRSALVHPSAVEPTE